MIIFLFFSTISGEGSRLYIYRISQKREVQPILTYRVLEKTNIHGIRLDYDGQALRKRVCIFGGRCIRVLLLDFSLEPICITAITNPITFQDWIWDVQWLHSKEIAIVLAQNYTILFDPLENQQKAVAQCEEKCILYCAQFVGKDWNKAAILSGTVFKEILIWCPVGSERSDVTKTESKVLHRLTGHDGVIFSIAYSADLRKLCSSSDDRSIQIWQHKIAESVLDGPRGSLTENEWRNSSFVFLYKLYGHEARVWKVFLTKEFYVSAGEDSFVCFWKCDDSKQTSELVKKFACHSGSSIRSLCFNSEETLLATGGEDGGIKLWSPPIKEENLQTVIHRIDLSQLNDKLQSSQFLSMDYPRELCLLDNHRILVMTNNGILFCYDMVTKTATLCINDAKFKSYCVMDITECAGVIGIGDIAGAVTFLGTDAPRPSDNHSQFEFLGNRKLFSGKILALKWIGAQQLLVCGPAGKIVSYCITAVDGKELTAELCHTFLLPNSKQRWFSAATIDTYHNLLLCGCRDGSIHVYSTDGLASELSEMANNERQPIQTLPRIHGSNGVTSFHLEANHGICTVYSTGRDGFLRTLEIDNGLVTELNKRWISCCPKWICGVTKHNDQLLVFGFYTDTFRVWNEQDQTILLEIPCGGGHRSWDFKLNSTEATYAFIKERQIRFCTLDSGANKPVCVKSSFHSRQTCHVCHLTTNHNKQYCITASEDMTLQILECLRTEATYTCTVGQTLKSHISSIKATATCPCKAVEGGTSLLMVSAGGRAQMIVWQLTIAEGLPRCSSQPPIRVWQITSHMLNPTERRRPVPWHEQTCTIDPETRYMDAVVWGIDAKDGHFSEALYIIGMACSDSYLRMYCLNTKTKLVSLLLEDPLHQHCILKISHFRTMNDREVVVTAATDGKVMFWDVTPVRDFVLDRECRDAEQKSGKTQPTVNVVASMQLHQSGITTMAILEESSSTEAQSFILATGGDDTAIAVRWLRVNAASDQLTGGIELIEKGSFSLPVAHSAQITGIHFLSPQYLVTASVDQRICVWSLQSEGSFGIKLAFSKISNVADISCITGWRENENIHCICATGKGLEIFEAIL